MTIPGGLIALFAAAATITPDSGWLFFNRGTSTGGGDPWLNPSRITADNSLYATCPGAGGSTDSSSLGGTEASTNPVPSGATIVGIEVEFGAFESEQATPTTFFHTVQLVKGGIQAGDNRADEVILETSETLYTYGGPSDLWGTTWTAAQVNDTNFGLSLETNVAGTQTVAVDYMRVKVYYTP